MLLESRCPHYLPSLIWTQLCPRSSITATNVIQVSNQYKPAHAVNSYTIAQGNVKRLTGQGTNPLANLLQGIEQLGLTAYPSEANFLFIHLQQPAGPVFEKPLRRGVIVRSGEALGMPTGLRVTIGSREQNERFLAALEEAIQVHST